MHYTQKDRKIDEKFFFWQNCKRKKYTPLLLCFFNFDFIEVVMLVEMQADFEKKKLAFGL